MRRTTLVFVPSAFIVAQAVNFYGFVLRARLALGYWPAPYNPDPKELGFEVHSALVILGFLGAAYITPALQLLVVALAHRGGAKRPVLLSAIGVYALLAVAGFALTRFDPWSLGDWFMD